jgi:hypothetical protein
LALWEEDNNLSGKRIYRSFSDKVDIPKFKKGYQYIAVSGRSLYAIRTYGGIRCKTIMYFEVCDEILRENEKDKDALCLKAKSLLAKKPLKIDDSDEVIDGEYDIEILFNNGGVRIEFASNFHCDSCNNPLFYNTHLHIYCVELEWTWKQEKVIWIGNKKNFANDCYLALLPREIVKHILSYCK